MSDQNPAVSLREYIEKIIAGHERELAVRLSAMEAALALARDDVARRLADLNQLRREVIEDRDQFVPKNQFEPMMRERDSWRDGISDRVTKIETKGNTWTVAIGVFFVIVQIAMMILFRNK